GGHVIAPLARRASRERGRDLAEETLELAALVPRGQPERHVPEPGVEIAAELVDALLRRARDRPALDERGAELRRVVGVEERLRFLEPLVAALADVDVVVERAPDFRRIAAFLARHRADTRELRAKLLGGELVGHPSVGESRHAPEASFDDRIGRAGAALPREPGRVRGDPDRDGVLHGTRLDCETV